MIRFNLSPAEEWGRERGPTPTPAERPVINTEAVTGAQILELEKMLAQKIEDRESSEKMITSMEDVSPADHALLKAKSEDIDRLTAKIQSMKNSQTPTENKPISLLDRIRRGK